MKIACSITVMTVQIINQMLKITWTNSSIKFLENDVIKYKQGWALIEATLRTRKNIQMTLLPYCLSDMLHQLTENHLIAKGRNQYLKARLNGFIKSKWMHNYPWLCLDFFICCSRRCTGNWNNAHTTIHPFIFYHNSINGDLCHKAFACISDHMTHYTVAVYVFMEKLINDYVKFYLPQLQKIQDFSDGLCAQYTKITKTLQIWFFIYKILVLQQSGTSLQLSTGRIHMIVNCTWILDGCSWHELIANSRQLQPSLNNDLQRLNISKVPGTITPVCSWRE